MSFIEEGVFIFKNEDISSWELIHQQIIKQFPKVEDLSFLHKVVPVKDINRSKRSLRVVKLLLNKSIYRNSNYKNHNLKNSKF